MGAAMMGDTFSNDEQFVAGAGQAAGNAVNSISNVETPSIAKMKIKLASLVQQGVLSTEMADNLLQQATAYNQMDPTARNALEGVVSAEGLDPQARAVLQQVQQEQGAVDRGAREAIMQDAAARGVAGSGLEMANRMNAQQGNATMAANRGFQAAAEANQRRMEAVQGLASMDQQKAAAQDAINQFNSANRMSWARNAEEKNLAEKQRIADQNVGLKNQQELYNKGLYQQDFQNRFAKGQALSNANLGVAQSNLQQGQMSTQPYMSEVAGQSAKWSDENLKTDITEIDPKEMLDDLTGYSYEYKADEGMPEGDQVGIMAQDLEEAAPQAVEDTPDGKMIDYSKMGGPMLAALASLNKRLNVLEGEKDMEPSDG